MLGGAKHIVSESPVPVFLAHQELLVLSKV